MHKTIENLYKKINDLKTKEEFLQEIQDIQNKNDQLLDQEAVALLIVDKLGRNNQFYSKISDLRSNTECSIVAKITNIKNHRIFNRKNGSTGKVTNLEITDETGTCGLALWDKDADLVKNIKIKIGTNLKIINGYIKNGYNGIEINVGRYSLIEIEPEQKINLKNEQISDIIKGTLIQTMPTKPYFKENGEFGFVTNIKIQTKDKIKEVTLWDDKVKEIQKYKIGEKIEIKNCDKKQKNGETQIHLNKKSKINKI
jgi:replication factor A1